MIKRICILTKFGDCILTKFYNSGVDTFAISRPCTRVPDKTAIIVEDRAGRFHCGDFAAFTCLQKDFECFKLVPWPN